jgi:hypothetical protein
MGKTSVKGGKKGFKPEKNRRKTKKKPIGKQKPPKPAKESGAQP